MAKRISKKKKLQPDFLSVFSSSTYNETVCNENDGTKKLCPLLHCDFSPSLINIPDDVFSNVGVVPDVVIVPQTIESASENAFSGCTFKFIYQTYDNEDRILSYDKLDLKDVKCSAPICVLKTVMPDLTDEKLMQIIDLNELMIFVKKVGATKTTIPFDFFCKLKEDNNVNFFMQNAYFKFFNKELEPYFKEFMEQAPKEQSAFFAFANALGCFSREFLVDEESETTEALLCHKASNLLARLLKSQTLTFGNFHYLFSNLPTDLVPNQSFYHFLASQNGKNNFVNAKLLLKNSLYYKDYFMRVMQEFDKAKGFKVTLDGDGQPIELPWGTALNRFYHSTDYKGVTKDNMSIAKIYGSRGLGQSAFVEACDIFAEAKLAGVPHHILGKPLKEVNDGTKMSTYEFLDKHDPKNGILGLYCSCCATLASEFYGRNITISSILEPDVQNVVVRDKNGTIIAKGTLYVNEKKGQAVFNDFEIERKYRAEPDIYYCDKDDEILTANHIKQQAILCAFIRAVDDFKVEYDKQHPEKPLKKVAVGMGYNKLMSVCEEMFEEAQPLLHVPKMYRFRDADNHQYLMLGKNIKRKMKTNLNKNNDDDREILRLFF